MIVKKVPTSKHAAPKSKALNVRALADMYARRGTQEARPDNLPSQAGSSTRLTTSSATCRPCAMPAVLSNDQWMPR